MLTPNGLVPVATVPTLTTKLNCNMGNDIIDKDGRVLVFSQEESNGQVYFKWIHKRIRAAFATCRNMGDVLMLVDIFVSNDLLRSQSVFMKTSTKVEHHRIDLRQQGIGKEVLATVVSYARNKGFKRIEGTMATVDLEPRINLERWYRDRGFTIKGPLIILDLSEPASQDVASR